MAQTLMTADGKQLVSDADHVTLQRLVTEASWRMDEGKASTLHELFVDNGELDMGIAVYRGREEIRSWGLERESSQTNKFTRHVAGNMRFVATGEDTAEGVTVLTVFTDDETMSSIPWVVGEDHDRFVRTGEGWRFAGRRWVRLFTRPAD